MKLIMMKGLPASGKSTYAKKLVDEKGYKRVNRDDLRSMIDNGKWTKTNENHVKKIQSDIALKFLQTGSNVVIDDTNLSPKNEQIWREVARLAKATFEVIDFTNVSVEICIERDNKRANGVGEKVIKKMHNEFLRPKVQHYIRNIDLPRCWIFDIDGTLAIKGDRSPYDWMKVGIDTVNEPIKHVFRSLVNFRSSISEEKIFIFSGRDEICREETEKWLKKNLIKHDGLFMRPLGDQRKDSIIKQELYESNIKDKYNLIAIFDDRNQVVEMWRSLGLNCFQVAEGDF